MCTLRPSSHCYYMCYYGLQINKKYQQKKFNGLFERVLANDASPRTADEFIVRSDQRAPLKGTVDVRKTYGTTVSSGSKTNLTILQNGPERYRQPRIPFATNRPATRPTVIIVFAFEKKYKKPTIIIIPFRTIFTLYM